MRFDPLVALTGVLQREVIACVLPASLRRGELYEEHDKRLPSDWTGSSWSTVLSFAVQVSITLVSCWPC
jgi:hypothetical protein